MNEVKTVQLGRQQFVVALDAHKALRDYLEAIGKQPGVQGEVVKEVEMRMAELLTERGIGGQKVVLAEDIDFLKKQLGEPGDFKDEEDEAAAEAADDEAADAKPLESGPRRLYRDPQNAWLAGVASGLAAYIGIDALIVRIAFIALTFASGAGILAYILLWLLAPEAKTPSERLQMQGKAVTVDSLKDFVERANIGDAGERAGRGLGRVSARIFDLFTKAILTIIGSALVAVGIVSMLWIVASAVYLLIHGGQVAGEIIFPIGSREVWLVILAAVAVLIIGFLILMTGIAAVRRRWLLPAWNVAALCGVLFVSLGIGVALGFDAAPRLADRVDDLRQTRVQNVDAFSSLTIKGNGVHYTFQPDSNYFLEVSYLGRADTAPLKTAINDGRLVIDSSGFAPENDCNQPCLYSDSNLRVTVHAPRLEAVSIDGTNNRFEGGEKLSD